MSALPNCVGYNNALAEIEELLRKEKEKNKDN